MIIRVNVCLLKMFRQLLVACLLVATGVNLLEARSHHERHSRSQALSPSLTHALQGGGSVQSMALLNNELFVRRRARRSARLEVYDATTFELLRTIELPGASHSMYGMAASPRDNAVYVSDANRHIFKIDLSQGSDSVTSWSTGQANFPKGLTVNGQGNVVVAITGANKIQVYSPSGSLLREIPVGEEIWEAKELDDGTFIGTRTGANDVVQIDADGAVLRSYGTNLQQLEYPTNLAVDSNGYILVIDQVHNRVVVLTPQLDDMRVLALPVSDLLVPRGLVLDESRGRLYVGESDGQTRVLVLDNVFNLRSAFTASSPIRFIGR